MPREERPASGRGPVFSIRGWESQLEDFWCRWQGGAPDWFRNEQYLAYLRDAFSSLGDAALADIPGLFERLDIPQLCALWPGGEVRTV